jgi:hypothetical protein
MTGVKEKDPASGVHSADFRGNYDDKTPRYQWSYNYTPSIRIKNI